MDAYDKDHLPPVSEMRVFRKTTTTPMWFTELNAPLAIWTQDGHIKLPAGWRGYIAIDRAGHPYPIAEAEHALTFEEVPF
jgi:hypothetical protein